MILKEIETEKILSDWRIHLLNLLDGDQEPEEHFPRVALRSQNLAVSVFLAEKAIPAFEEFKAELTKYGRLAFIIRDRNAITIEINYEDALELSYSIVLMTKMGWLQPQVNIRYLDRFSPVQETISLPFGELDPTSQLNGIKKSQIISHLVSMYTQHTGKP